MIVISCQKCGPLPYAFNPISVDAIRISPSSIDVAELSRCRICGGKLTVRDEMDTDRVREYIELFSGLDPDYKDELAGQVILDFFMTYEEKKRVRDSLAKVKDRETVMGQPHPLNDVFREPAKRAIDRYETFLKFGNPDERSLGFVVGRELTLAENAEIVRASVTGDGAALINLILSGNRPIILQLLRFAVFMHIMPNLCEGCSRCCERIKTIGLYAADMERMAAYLKIPRAEFEVKYVRTVKDEEEEVLRTFKRTAPCIWLKSGRCTIYPARPNVCVFYPFLTDLQPPPIFNAIIVPPDCRSGQAILELLQGAPMGGA